MLVFVLSKCQILPNFTTKILLKSTESFISFNAFEHKSRSKTFIDLHICAFLSLATRILATVSKKLGLET